MQESEFDVVVIGAGPGGYVAAIYAAQNGLTTALVSKEDDLGGTCLNRGCIPSKALIASSEIMETIKEAKNHGIQIEGKVEIDFSQVIERKNRVVEQMQKGLNTTIDSFGVKQLTGQASFMSPNLIKVLHKDKSSLLKARFVIIATGSTEMNIPKFPFDHEVILSSKSLLDLKKLPKTLGIVGGGYIGCEIASFMSQFGVEVIIIEALDQIIKNVGPIASQALSDHFTKHGVKILTSKKVESIEKKKTGASIRLESKEELFFEKVLVSIGRSPVTEGLNLDKAGLTTNAKGFIEANDSMQTAQSHIYAIGDVTGKMMLAHAASFMAKVAIDHIKGKRRSFTLSSVPAVIFTSPEIATVGLMEGKSATFPMKALGKAEATGKVEGSITIYTDPKHGKINGAIIIGYQATTLIATMALAIQNELTIDEFDSTIAAHPTYPEALWEAVMMTFDKQIHFPKKRR